MIYYVPSVSVDLLQGYTDPATGAGVSSRVDYPPAHSLGLFRYRNRFIIPSFDLHDLQDLTNNLGNPPETHVIVTSHLNNSWTRAGSLMPDSWIVTSSSPS